MHTKISLSPEQTGCDSGSVVLTGAEMQKLDGKNVLVTGVSSGIGQAIAVRFCASRNIAIHYRSGAEQAESP